VVRWRQVAERGGLQRADEQPNKQHTSGYGHARRSRSHHAPALSGGRIACIRTRRTRFCLFTRLHRAACQNELITIYAFPEKKMLVSLRKKKRSFDPAKKIHFCFALLLTNTMAEGSAPRINSLMLGTVFSKMPIAAVFAADVCVVHAARVPVR
jgi:hypothetical protein